jgi:hypothetical protein
MCCGLGFPGQGFTVRNHGQGRGSNGRRFEEIRLDGIGPELSISIDNVTRQLEDEGIEKINKPFDKLMGTLEKAAPK